MRKETTETDLLKENGWFLRRKVFDGASMSKLALEIETAIEQEDVKWPVRENDHYGRLLLACAHAGSFLSILESEPFMSPFVEALGLDCIVYTMTTSSLASGESAYASRIHVDSPRHIPCYLTTLVGMILVTDLNMENGCTRVLSGSHKLAETPDPIRFEESAEPILGQAGDVLYFDPRLWHAAGKNESEAWRHVLLLGMIRPWMKQRFDIPKMMADLKDQLSENQLLRLGFNSQPPDSYSDYFKPKKERSFKSSNE